jgi:hypothetical protein
LTLNAPTGTPVNGQKLILRLRSTNVQTFSWNAAFAGSTDLALPVASSGSLQNTITWVLFTTQRQQLGKLLPKTLGSKTWQLVIGQVEVLLSCNFGLVLLQIAGQRHLQFNLLHLALQPHLQQ